MAKSYVATTINGESAEFLCEPQQSLLDVLRDVVGLTGTKYGCGIEECGACTIMIGGGTEKSCDMTLADAGSSNITTIEAIGATALGKAVQQAWIDLQVPQCGYCQSGMILAAVSLLQRTPKPTDAQIDSAMRNICACGTYVRVRAAIHKAAGQ